MKHVIVGAGAAGITAAKTIRELRPQDQIELISADEHVHSRCMLHKYISGERELSALSFVDEGFFERNRVVWRGGLRVTGVDTDSKAVLYNDGRIYYDKLLIATGSDSVIPPVGALRTAKNVFGIRHLSDATAIREAALQARRAVVLGAGLTGLDAAYALLEMKKDVTVVEMLPGILSLNLDKRAAQTYKNLFEEAGCKFHLWRMLVNTVEDRFGNVAQVVLEDGTVLDCDFLVSAAGVRPAVGFLEGSGIAHEFAVTVDKHMATSCPDVYAAGDVAGLSAIWPNAMRQGEVAAKNMCGAAEVYDDSFTAKNTINFFGLTTLSVGEFEQKPGDTVVQREDRRMYQKVIMRNGCVAGIIMQGDISGCGFWQYLIKNRIRVDGVQKPIWKISFADFCELEESGEYRWAVAGNG